MHQPTIHYLAINLPSSEKRRASILAEGRKFGIDFQLVPAVSGAELTEEDLSHYDHQRRLRSYPFGLTRNEIACTTSHRRALQAFLNSGKDYGLILEDDALLQPHFREGIAWAIQKLHGWQVAKLYAAEGKLYPIKLAHMEGAPVHPVFPRKLLWIAMGYLYTREGARLVLEGLEHFWLPADAQIGQTLLTRRIPTIGLEPSLITNGDPTHEFSDIDSAATVSRTETAIRTHRNMAQYIRYRLGIWHTACNKIRMRRLLRRVLHCDTAP